jgi:hypothetical protein
MGAPTQAVNTYLDDTIGRTLLAPSPANDIPAFRGVLGFVWRGAGPKSWLSAIFKTKGGYIGTTGYPKPWAFTARRILKGWHNGVVWYSAKATIDTAHMNPAHIVYQAITDPEWGLGLPTSAIDTAAFTAAADTLYAEGFGLSIIWNQPAGVDDFIRDVLNHISGSLSWDKAAAKFRLTLLRDDYDPGTLPQYGPDTIGQLTGFQRQLWGETTNELTLVYTDPTTLKDTSVTAHDLANIRSQNARVSAHAFARLADHVGVNQKHQRPPLDPAGAENRLPRPHPAWLPTTQRDCAGAETAAQRPGSRAVQLPGCAHGPRPSS